MKPTMNLDEATFDDIEENRLYTSRRASLGRHIGTKNFVSSKRSRTRIYDPQVGVYILPSHAIVR